MSMNGNDGRSCLRMSCTQSKLTNRNRLSFCRAAVIRWNARHSVGSKTQKKLMIIISGSSKTCTLMDLILILCIDLLIYQIIFPVFHAMAKCICGLCNSPKSSFRLSSANRLSIHSKFRNILQFAATNILDACRSRV